MSDAALKTLLSRLETVTSRLETVEKQIATGGPSSSTSSGSSSGASESGASSVAEFAQLIAQYIDEYVTLSGKIDPLVKQQADLVKRAVSSERELLNVAAQAKKPSDNVLVQLLKPTSDLMAEITKIRDSSRGHEKFNHLSTLSEGITALGWVTVSPTPGPFVDESRASSEFYSNKILMKYRHDQSEEGKTNVAWVNAWNTFLKELRQWIKTHHTTGLSWSSSGADASSFVGKLGGSSSSSSTGSGAPPPPAGGPPPPPPAGAPPVIDSSSGGGGNPHGALFAEINSIKDRQKGGRTEGLRKVTADMKSKNQKDRPAVVSATPKTSSSTTARKAATTPSRPPNFALEGNKWLVEYQTNNRDIVIENPETRQTVYIYKSENCVVQVKGKVNAITIDGCKKTAVVFEDAISTIEVVNCSSIQVQVTGKVPSVQVDKTSGCQIFLSKDSLDVEIVTSKSDELNVVLPPATAQEDITEIAIPEQFKTIVKDRQLVTEAVAHV